MGSKEEVTRRPGGGKWRSGREKLRAMAGTLQSFQMQRRGNIQGTEMLFVCSWPHLKLWYDCFVLQPQVLWQRWEWMIDDTRLYPTTAHSQGQGAAAVAALGAFPVPSTGTIFLFSLPLSSFLPLPLLSLLLCFCVHLSSVGNDSVCKLTWNPTTQGGSHLFWKM